MNAFRLSQLSRGVTHHKEWNTFNRQCNNRKVFPVQLANHLLKNKQDLFQTWMESGKDWDRVVLTVNRTNKQRNISESGWKAEQGKTIKENWKGDQQKLKQLLKSRVDSGLFYDDPDFPDDEDEICLQLRHKYTLPEVIAASMLGVWCFYFRGGASILGGWWYMAECL